MAKLALSIIGERDSGQLAAWNIAKQFRIQATCGSHRLRFVGSRERLNNTTPIWVSEWAVEDAAEGAGEVTTTLTPDGLPEVLPPEKVDVHRPEGPPQENGWGPGSQSKLIMEGTLKVKPNTGCGCEATAQWMDHLGVIECGNRVSQIAGILRDNAGKRWRTSRAKGITRRALAQEWLGIGWRFVRRGLVLRMITMRTLSPYRVVVKLAIKRARAAEPSKQPCPKCGGNKPCRVDAHHLPLRPEQPTVATPSSDAALYSVITTDPQPALSRA